MKTIRRWTATIVSSFDRVISQVENHEALVASALQEVHESRGRAQAQLKRVRKDGDAMRTRLDELRRTEELWRSRAASTAAQDEKKALECVRRAKRLRAELQDLEKQEREHSKVEAQLGEDLAAIQSRIEELTRQKNLMRTRQSRAEALATLSKADGNPLAELESIFDRWESKISEYELTAECSSEPEDELESSFISQEEEADLKSELASILGSGQA